MNGIVVLEKTLESPLDYKEIQPVYPRGNQSWIFIGRTDAETPIFWPTDAKNWLIGKDPDAGKDWRQEEKGTTEDEIVGWHHQLNAHEFEQAPRVGDGQGSLACYHSWGCKESDTLRYWTELSLSLEFIYVLMHFVIIIMLIYTLFHEYKILFWNLLDILISIIIYLYKVYIP